MTINADIPDADNEASSKAERDVPSPAESTELVGAIEATDAESVVAEDAAEPADGAAVTDEGLDPDDVDALVAAGKYEAAARAAKRRGHFARAAELFERIWQFSLAAECAMAAGDLGRALRNAIDARDEPLATRIRQQLCAEGEAGARVALAVLAKKQQFAQAGPLAESVGELEQAIEHYKDGHRELDAARLLEQVGRDREAGRLLERFVQLGPPGDERARAQLALGLLLARRMNHSAAARYLQEAVRHQVTRAPARRALVVALAAMGLRDAARDVLVAARTDEPDLPADIDQFVRGQRDRLLPSADAKADAKDDAKADDETRVQIIGGRYRLADLIGAGGAGRVFQARDEVSGRDCAVKVFHTAHSRGNQAYERFVREAKLASSLRHPNLVEVFDFSADQGYMVMELMSGSLLDRVAAGPLPGRVVKRLALDLLAGLELVHQRGVIHRDVKPANVFFDARGTAKLGDFGVAHLLDLGQTQTGGLIGTLAYMSPEQITGAPLTITADLYSLGITLFEALTGRLPFLGPDFVAQHLGESAPAPSSVHDQVAGSWDAVMRALLRKSPGERAASIDQLRKQLQAVDLGEHNRPKVLLLHRAGTRDGTAHTEAAATPQTKARDEPVATAPAADEEDAPRYQFETPLGSTDISRISRALDTVLERSVIIERFREGALDDVTERRLYALARGGGPFVQRALSYDQTHGVAVFEAPSGTVMSDAFAGNPPSRRGAARLMKRLARALEPLHEHGNAHGALQASTVLVDEELNPTILVCGLGAVTTDASPAGDVRAVLDLLVSALRSEASASESGASVVELAHALLTDMPVAQRDALARQPMPTTGQELYAWVDGLEIAMLQVQLQTPSS